MMIAHRPIRIIAALFNISLYFYIFFHELPKSLSGNHGKLAVNSTNPVSISVPQSIAQSTVKIYIWRDFCPHPIVRVRLVGPEIHAFPPFVADSASSPNVHVVDIDIQKSSLLVGVYRVEASLIRCHEGKAMAAVTTNGTTANSCTVVSEWYNEVSIGDSDNDWVWVYSPKCNDGGKHSPECAQPGSYSNQGDYVLMEINRETKNPEYNNLFTLRDGITTLSKPKSLLPTSDDKQQKSILQYFSQLSNYELACWLGDDDARLYWRSFMELFPFVGSQKPFKFKYIKLLDVADPPKHIEYYDKCKIIFISYGLNRFEAGISPQSYGEEIKTLLGHIEKSHPDRTYPVWWLSPRSSTLIPNKATSCVEDLGYQGRTPDRIHAFTEVARQTFQPQLESRIQFLDNSDITEAFWHIFPTKENTASKTSIMETQITSAVAMRCIEKIAQQVKAWRSINQIGTQNGLFKNGTLIPNNVLYKEPYTWGK